MGGMMIVYEYYWRDGEDTQHFIGLLPERRRDSERITPESILDLLRSNVGNMPEIRNIYYVQIEM